MEVPKVTCPVISAFSELKQFADYPTCHENCGWYDSYMGCCSVRSVAMGLHDLSEKKEQVGNIWDTMDYSTKQDLSNVLRGLSNLLERLGMRIGS